ncbi:MAG: hypothetical protein LBJ13_00760 [Puniceicoccales bacterium]|jgi:hypothetical protein|nr:hypothetical protein [Puniceicoccales bacterium]
MKNLLIVVGGILVSGYVCGGFQMPTLSVDSKIEFNTASISRGRYSMGKNVVPNLIVGIPVSDSSKLSLGVEGTFKTDSAAPGGNDVLFLIEFRHDLTDLFAITFGYSYDYGVEKNCSVPSVNNRAFALVNGDGNFILDSNGNDAGGHDDATFLAKDEDAVRKSVQAKRFYHEVSVGLSANVLLHPGVYCKYDFTQGRVNLGSRIGHTINLHGLEASGLSIRLGAELGYVHVKKPNGIAGTTPVIFETLGADGAHNGVEDYISNLYGRENWTYVGSNADLVYFFNEHAKARVGAAVICNSAANNSWVNANNGKKHKVWFSSAVEFAF